MPVETNPKKPQEPYTTWRQVWNELVKNNLHNEARVRMCYREQSRPRRIDRPDDAFQYIEVEYDLSYLKQKCWDEAQEKLPYEMNYEIFSQALQCVPILKEQFRVIELADWLEKIALQERERVYNEK
jgi:hypothetical protein